MQFVVIVQDRMNMGQKEKDWFRRLAAEAFEGLGGVNIQQGMRVCV